MVAEYSMFFQITSSSYTTENKLRSKFTIVQIKFFSFTSLITQAT